MDERRNSRRVTFYCEAQLEGIDVSNANVRLADLSTEGAFVDARTVLPPGAVANFRFTLLGQQVTTRAEVRYSMPGMGMGLRFVGLAPESRDLIARFIDGR
jgi:hypothetical protein